MNAAGPRRVMVVFGTRPDAVKMAPVVRALRAHPEELRPVVVVTAQHREMLDQVLRLFGIEPDWDLNIMTERQTLADVTVRTLRGLEETLARVDPAIVLVQGDAAPSFVGALAAFYRKTPVAHVEAGLRTDDKYQPFPEEMYRRMTTVLADLHFAPTATARAHLEREGVPRDRIVVTGNTVIDALLEIAGRDAGPADPRVAALLAGPGRRILLTTHRRENWGEPAAPRLSRGARSARPGARPRAHLSRPPESGRRRPGARDPRRAPAGAPRSRRWTTPRSSSA